MAAKKRRSTSVEEPDVDMDDDEVEDSDTMDEGSDGDSGDAEKVSTGAAPEKVPEKLKPMELKKKRKALDKERNRSESKSDQLSKKAKKWAGDEPRLTPGSVPDIHMGVFTDLASADSAVREAAAEALARELQEAQSVHARCGEEREDVSGAVRMEAEKDDGLENCARPLRYALRRLIRGVSSSRECARQGFATGLTIVLATIPAIKVNSVMKLVVDSLEISSSMKGQEARDNFLGRLFAYGALAGSGRISGEWISDNSSSCLEEFISNVISLARKKRYLQEPAVSVILELVDRLPAEAILNHVLEVHSMREWFQKATSDNNPDALFLALKLQERISVDSDVLRELLPHPFSPNSFFSSKHLSSLVPCFQESTFCQPRVHSLWPLLISILVPDAISLEDAVVHTNSSKKHKKNRKGNSSEDVAKNIRCFSEIVIEGSLLLSSHDRKHLAFDILLLLLPRLPGSCVQIILSHKLVHCLMDILSTKGSWLYSAAQHFLKDLINQVGDDSDRLVAVIISLQKHSNGRFDCITRTHTVKDLVSKFNTGPGCMLFVHSLIDLFVDEGGLQDELSDHSQTTDENSEKGSTEDSAAMSGNPELMKSWVIDTLPRVLKNLKLGSEKCLPPSEIAKFLEVKFRLQTEIMKFLTVQGLFSASLGTEVTSFELQEKFKWPKTASSASLCRLCIKQLQSVMEDAQKGDGSILPSNDIESNDLGSYFICFLNTLCNIPSVSLFRTLSDEDERAFKKLQSVETRLFQEERRIGPGVDANKLHALRYLLTQLLLQVFLYPGKFSEAASELVICCKKSFPGAVQSDSLEEEEEEIDDENDDGMPDMMDVLVDTLLSLLFQSTGPVCYAVEQVFRFFCNEITDTGLLRMLHVIKKYPKPPRRQTAESDDDEEEDEDVLGVEDVEETSEVDAVETVDSDDQLDDADGKLGFEGSDDEPDDDMDDEAMFRMDSYITQFLKKSGKSGNDTATSQLMLFKLHILSLLEIYLHKNPGKPQVLTIYSYLARAFVNYHSAEGCKQLGERIGGILQKKIFKAKEYPRSNEIQVSSLETLLEKSLKSASRARVKSVSSLAKNSAFWILKIIQSRNLPESELEGVVRILQQLLADYFNNKKFRRKPEFIKEILRRHPWVGHQLFGFLLEKCANVKSEFRRIKALDLVDWVMKSCLSTSKGESEKDISRKSKFLKGHLPLLAELIQQLLMKLPEIQSRRVAVRRFCTRAFDAISGLKLNKPFLKSLKQDAYSACETQLGDLFIAFKNPNRED